MGNGYQEAADAFVAAGFAGLQLQVNDWVGTAGEARVGEHFWAGSVAKTFTATLVLQLVAEGKLDLDAPLAIDERITMRMLLLHTSGLFNYTGEYYPDGTFAPGIPATGQDWIDNRLTSYTAQELVDLALSKPRRFEPGTDWSYSNTNYTLATLIIEQVTGDTYGNQMRQRILQPLGLNNTILDGEVTDLPEPYARGFYLGQDVSRQNLSMLTGAGGAITTTQDLHVFFAALNSGRLLPTALLDEMRTPHGPIDYGLGIFVQDHGALYHHNGGAPGGYGALMYSNPDGTKTLTAGITTKEDPAEFFPQALDTLVRAVFAK